MKRKVYIIPGYTEHPDMPSYQAVMDLFRAQGFHPIPVHITWKRRTMSAYVQEFLAQAKQHNEGDEVYLFGFSFGAMIALLASQTLVPKAQLLCSLSPYFSEDIPSLPGWWKSTLGIKRMKDFRNLHFGNIAPHISCETLLLAGTEEGKHIDRRAKEAHKLLKPSQLTFISEAKHDIAQPEYVAAIQKAITQLST